MLSEPQLNHNNNEMIHMMTEHPGSRLGWQGEVERVESLETIPGTSFLVAVLEEDRARIAESIKKDQDVVHFTDDSGRNAIHYFDETKNLENLAFLIDRGADVNHRDGQGRTPLHTLATMPCKNFLKRCRFAKHMQISGADVDAKDMTGRTPIHIAIANNDLSTVKAFYACGASLDIPDALGNTAVDLVLLLEEEALKYIEWMAEIGVFEPNRLNAFGQRPLNVAFQAPHSDVRLVAKLIKLGADPTLPNLFGISPFQMLATLHRPSLIAFFVELENKCRLAFLQSGQLPDPSTL